MTKDNFDDGNEPADDVERGGGESSISRESDAAAVGDSDQNQEAGAPEATSGAVVPYQDGRSGGVLRTLQLCSVAPTTTLEGPVQGELMEGTMQLYRDFDPRPGREASLARVGTGLTNLAMTCIARALATTDLTAFDINAKYGIKAAEALVKVSGPFDQEKPVTVANVNVGSCGQTIVGPVTINGRDKGISNIPAGDEDDAEGNG